MSDSFKDNIIKMYGQWNYGYNFNAHIEAYWKAKKIVVDYKWDGFPDMKYQATLGDYDLDCKVGYGRTADEAIEELLIALE